MVHGHRPVRRPSTGPAGIRSCATLCAAVARAAGRPSRWTWPAAPASSHATCEGRHRASTRARGCSTIAAERRPDGRFVRATRCRCRSPTPTSSGVFTGPLLRAPARRRARSGSSPSPARGRGAGGGRLARARRSRPEEEQQRTLNDGSVHSVYKRYFTGRAGGGAGRRRGAARRRLVRDGARPERGAVRRMAHGAQHRCIGHACIKGQQPCWVAAAGAGRGRHRVRAGQALGASAARGDVEQLTGQKKVPADRVRGRHLPARLEGDRRGAGRPERCRAPASRC